MPLPFMLPKFPKARLEKPPETLAGRAFLAAKPYLEKGKGNPGLLAIWTNLEMFIGIIEQSPTFQKEFYDWFQEVKSLETEFSLPPEAPQAPIEPPTEINNIVHQAKEMKGKLAQEKQDAKEESDQKTETNSFSR